MEKGKNSMYIILITIVATLGGLLFGYDTAVISGTTSSLGDFFVEPLGLEETAANSLKGFIISSALIGCIIGGILGGLLSSKYGRKNTLIVAAILFFISALGSAFPEIGIRSFGEADHTFVWHFIVYRIIGGVGVGLASMISPMYISEIAPADKRGTLVSFNQFAIIFGMLVVYFVNYGIASSGDDNWLNEIGWRYMFASEMIPATLFLVCLFFVPETPRFMALRGQDESALKVLGKINGAEKAKAILADIKNTVESHSGNILSYGVGIIVIGILLSAFQQFVGINVVLYYAPEIFKKMGSGTDAALMQTIIVGIINLTFTVVAILTVDRFGRKPLMIIGAVGMALSMGILGTLFYSQNVGMPALICMLAYTASFAVSWGPVCWVLLAEIFPNKIRSKALALAVACQWVSNWLVSWTFPMMNDSTWLTDKFNNGFAFWIYGVMGVLAAVFVWKWVPETKGKTLEEMEGLWTK
ncbi:D-xylose transporter XylE [Saccharicrinis aurantiacus]|uniref:D-xylose transporter XylE n=1 Tax=Saccharicrinis aurantiacus TaxID=1849719 RepID=UPI0024917B24|nr:D-xylose transporter XylE [Saccharicrinis aurantiacus]